MIIPTYIYIYILLSTIPFSFSYIFKYFVVDNDNSNNNNNAKKNKIKNKYQDTSEIVFERKPKKTSGLDERYNVSLISDYNMTEFRRYMRKQIDNVRLLTLLKKDNISIHEKLKLLRENEKTECLDVNTANIKSSNIKLGGLLDEWNYEFFTY